MSTQQTSHQSTVKGELYVHVCCKVVCMYTSFRSVVYFGSCVCNRLESLASMFSVVPTICFGFQVRFYKKVFLSLHHWCIICNFLCWIFQHYDCSKLVCCNHYLYYSAMKLVLQYTAAWKTKRWHIGFSSQSRLWFSACLFILSQVSQITILYDIMCIFVELIVTYIIIINIFRWVFVLNWDWHLVAIWQVCLVFLHLDGK